MSEHPETFAEMLPEPLASETREALAAISRYLDLTPDSDIDPRERRALRAQAEAGNRTLSRAITYYAAETRRQ